jgi:hypothetical protein
MGGSFKIGRFSGIDVKVHWTFLLLLAFFAFIGYQSSGSLAGALTPIAVIVALFICVLLHEFGHSLVAQRLGIEIHSITLLPIGGVSNLESIPEKPSDEVKITLAGPLVNVVLAPIFFGVGLLLGAEPRMPTDLFTGIGSVGQFFFYLGYLNVVLALQPDPSLPFGRGTRVAGSARNPPGSTKGHRDRFEGGAAVRLRLLPDRTARRQLPARPDCRLHLLRRERRGPDGQTKRAHARIECLGRHGYQA